MVENKSVNTYENIKLSNELITKKKAKSNIAFATTNYHVFRAGTIAAEQGLLIEGIGSKTYPYFWINAFVREFVATLYSEKKKHILIIIALLLYIFVAAIAMYFTNMV